MLQQVRKSVGLGPLRTGIGAFLLGALLVTLVAAILLAVRLAQPELGPPAPPPVERSDALTYSLVAEQHLPLFARTSAVCRALPVAQLVPAGWHDVAAADLGLIGCAGSSDSPAGRPLC